MSQSSVTPLRQKTSAKSADRKNLDLLLVAWKHEKTKRDISLKEMADVCQVSYETVRPTFKGTRSLTELWMLRFARYLDKYPQDIWPDWEFKDMTPGGGFSPQINLIALKAQGLTSGARKLLLLELDQLSMGSFESEAAEIAMKANAVSAETRKLLLAQLDHAHKLESRKLRAVPVKD